MTTYQKILAAVFAVFLIVFSIHPADRADWFLEMLPVFLGIIAIYILGRYVRLSSVSYTCAALYFTLPVIAAHYGVAGVPFGFTLGHWLGTTRNMFDRLEHFSYGFLTANLIREGFIGITKTKGFWSYYFPIDVTLALSALYEIFEWIGGATVRPSTAASFVGAQGDFWDTPKDMAMATAGVIIAMLIILGLNMLRYRRIKKAEAALQRADS
jgi:putative membrane protein